MLQRLEWRRLGSRDAAMDDVWRGSETGRPTFPSLSREHGLLNDSIECVTNLQLGALNTILTKERCKNGSLFAADVQRDLMIIRID